MRIMFPERVATAGQAFRGEGAPKGGHQWPDNERVAKRLARRVATCVPLVRVVRAVARDSVPRPGGPKR